MRASLLFNLLMLSCANPLGGGSSSQAGFLSSFNLIDNTSALFGQGVGTGLLWDSNNNFLRTGNTGDCNGSVTDCNSDDELNASWTPAWSNLIAYWKLNEPSTATTIADSSPVGTNSGTPNSGVTLNVAAKIKAGASFDGNTGQITVTPGVNLSGTSFTLSAWAKRSGSTNSFILGQASGGQDASLQLGFRAGNGFTFAFFSDDLNVTIASDSNWHLWTATYDATSRLQSLYQDGVFISSRTATGSYVGTGSVLIGQAAFSSGYAYSGSIDEVAIWNTNLSQAQIQSIYNHQSSNYVGVFNSRVMDGKLSNLNWLGLNWTPTLPFFKELPDALSSTPQNETTANYSSLVGDTPALSDNNLMTGIVGLWHLDEPAGTTGPNSVLDRSGYGNHGAPGAPANVTFGVNGRFGTSVNFNGATTSYVAAPDSTSLDPSSSLTVSAWINCNSLSAIRAVVHKWGYFTATPDQYNLYINTTGVVTFAIQQTNGAVPVINAGSIAPGRWTHLVGIANAATGHVYLYINGILVGSTTYNGTLNIPASPDPLVIGAQYNAGVYVNNFSGNIDEVAIWNKPLNQAEVVQLYRRGANRIKYQVRTCSDPACASNPTWLGPDGTNQTYFSEVNNNSVPSAGGDLNLLGRVNAILPSLTFLNFTPLLLPSNRYFQYHLVMESDDAGMNCTYAGAAAPCSPELQSVTVSP